MREGPPRRTPTSRRKSPRSPTIPTAPSSRRTPGQTLQGGAEPIRGSLRPCARNPKREGWPSASATGDGPRPTPTPRAALWPCARSPGRWDSPFAPTSPGVCRQPPKRGEQPGRASLRPRSKGPAQRFAPAMGGQRKSPRPIATPPAPAAARGPCCAPTAPASATSAAQPGPSSQGGPQGRAVPRSVFSPLPLLRA